MKRKLDDDNVPVPASVDDTPGRYDSSTFSSFRLDSRLQQAILKEQYSRPTLVQSKAIPLALEGRDILGRFNAIFDTLPVNSADNCAAIIEARSKTGSGKTAAYLLPILESVLRRKLVRQHAFWISLNTDLRCRQTRPTKSPPSS